MADEVRLIDAELLTTNIAQIAKYCARSDAQKALIGRILFMIENMPTIEAEPDNGWISVDDRLPDVFKNVLTINSKGKIRINWLEDIIVMKGYFAYDSGSVTHWQYLPEPPKGGIINERQMV